MYEGDRLSIVAEDEASGGVVIAVVIAGVVIRWAGAPDLYITL